MSRFLVSEPMPTGLRVVLIEPVPAGLRDQLVHPRRGIRGLLPGNPSAGEIATALITRGIAARQSIPEVPAVGHPTIAPYLLLALPGSVVDRLIVEAAAEGCEPGELLIDLLATELPQALADAARGLFQTNRGRRIPRRGSS